MLSTVSAFLQRRKPLNHCSSGTTYNKDFQYSIFGCSNIVKDRSAKITTHQNAILKSEVKFNESHLKELLKGNSIHSTQLNIRYKNPNFLRPNLFKFSPNYIITATVQYQLVRIVMIYTSFINNHTLLLLYRNMGLINKL